MGLTVGCARCHDHKFDPISQRDYYSLFAFFNQTPVNGGGGDPQTAPILDIATEEQRARAEKLGSGCTTSGRSGKRGNVSSPRQRPVGGGIRLRVRTGGEVQSRAEEGPGKRSSKETDELQKQFEKNEPEYAAHLGKQREAIAARDALSKSIPRVMVMEDAKGSAENVHSR